MECLRELHAQMLREVLHMKQLTPEQIGIDYRALLDLIGEDRVIDLIGEDRAIDLIGEDRVIDLIGEEQLVQDLLRRKGEHWLRAMLERITKQRSIPDAPQTPTSPEA